MKMSCCWIFWALIEEWSWGGRHLQLLLQPRCQNSCYFCGLIEDRAGKLSLSSVTSEHPPCVGDELELMLAPSSVLSGSWLGSLVLLLMSCFFLHKLTLPRLAFTLLDEKMINYVRKENSHLIFNTWVQKHTVFGLVFRWPKGKLVICFGFFFFLSLKTEMKMGEKKPRFIP